MDSVFDSLIVVEKSEREREKSKKFVSTFFFCFILDEKQSVCIRNKSFTLIQH